MANATVHCLVVDATTDDPIAGATVTFVYPTQGTAIYVVSNTTGADGRCDVGVFAPATWRAVVEADGYQTHVEDVYVHGNMSKTFELVPEGAVNYTPPMPPPGNQTPPYPPIVINETEYWWLSVQVVWPNGMPFEGAEVDWHNLDTCEHRVKYTNGTGFVHFLTANGTRVGINVTAVNPQNASDVYTEYRELTVAEHVWLVFVVQFAAPPAPPGENWTLVVHTYDAFNLSDIADAWVTAQRDSFVLGGYTNSSGLVQFSLPFNGTWIVNASKAGYLPASQSIYVFGSTWLALPMVPAGAQNYTQPPTNATYPPVYYNETYWWWLSVQVVWKDGAPFENALVTVTNVTDGSVLLQRRTNGTGFVHALLPNCTDVKVEVNATHPENANLTYYAYRELHMGKHQWLVFSVPWYSEYFAPEVALVNCTWWIHRGQGYYRGPVRHLIECLVWTNVEQDATVEVRVYYNETGELIAAVNKTVHLVLGVNPVWVWPEVNITEGGAYYAVAEIVQYQNDTDPNNNRLRSNCVFLKPYVNIQVFVIWKPIAQKLDYAVLPEDTIEVSIGVYVPLPLEDISMEIGMHVYNVTERVFEVLEEREEIVETKAAGIVWRNYTIELPWTSRINVSVSALHEWEDVLSDNYATVTILVDPDVKVERVEAPAVVGMGEERVEATVYLKHNVELGHGAVSVWEEGEVLLGRKDVELPAEVVEVEFRVPENDWLVPEMVRQPVQVHELVVQFGGYDLYLGNNEQEVKMTVARPWFTWGLVALGGLVAVLLVFALVRAARHAVAEAREAGYRFVRRKRGRYRFVQEVGGERGKEARYKFVRRKGED